MSSFGIHYLIGLCVTELHKVTRVSLCTTAASTSLASIGYRWKSKKIHKQSAVTLTSSGLTVIILVAGTERPLYTEVFTQKWPNYYTSPSLYHYFYYLRTLLLMITGLCNSLRYKYESKYFINFYILGYIKIRLELKFDSTGHILHYTAHFYVISS